jgi:hypothetical protein
MTATAKCEALERLRSDAVAAICEAKKIRRSRDVSIYEDAELSRESHRRIDALIKHLLAGHDGLPCPAGDRPIVRAETSSADSETASGFLLQPVPTGKS